jgi:hypothetical protein
LETKLRASRWWKSEGETWKEIAGREDEVRIKTIRKRGKKEPP